MGGTGAWLRVSPRHTITLVSPQTAYAIGPPELCRFSHIELVTTDLEQSLDFFDHVLGLETISRESDVAYLRAWGDADDHSLILRAGDQPGVGHIAWRTRRPEDVERFADMLLRDGFAVEPVADGSEPAQGPAIRVRTPAGFLYELFHEFEVRAAPSTPVLKTNSARPYDHGVSPRRIDHVNLTMAAMAAEAHWVTESLGLRMRDYLTRDGETYAAWFAASALHHEVGMGLATDGAARSFHHLAYYVDGPAEVVRAATLLTERGLRPQHIGRHGVSQALSLYVLDPGSGHRLEIYSGAQLIFDPDYKPVEWPPDEYRQWWGPELPPELWTNSPA